ncbi:putative prophage LambdaSo holin [Brucella rhizosphaerae]|uniref:Putative prophage LambdaSo holin n=1 Tax=Brucella rhizosphaerae TaxID=571254 RepID=A0A256FHM3_9HYPH|nr:putative prophage LambdaSo holin [Brucella rhizosphaerae]
MASKPRTFRPAHLGTVKQERAAYEVRRGSARDRGYTSRWDKAAVTYKRDNPLCIGCEAVDRVEVAKVVDHIIPHKGDQSLFWDKANWQACCAMHHDIVKQYLERQFEQGLLSAGDLRLTSSIAKAATLRLMPR